MRIRLLADETLSTGPAVAGSTINITPSNSDECYALALMSRAVLIDEDFGAPASGDVGPATASLVASGGAISITNGSPLEGRVPGEFIARVRSNLPGAVQIIDDGGGRIAISGRSIVAGAVPFVKDVLVSIRLAIGAVERTFLMYPIGESLVNGIPANALRSAISGEPLRSAISGEILISALGV